MFAYRLISSVSSTLLKASARKPMVTIAPTIRTLTTMSNLSPMTLHRQAQLSSSLISPTATTTNSPILTSLITLQAGSIFSNGAVGLGLGQRRWKARGNNYQPNTYKRKRTLGFMSRMRSKTGRVIIARRKAKGRWYLAH